MNEKEVKAKNQKPAPKAEPAKENPLKDAFIFRGNTDRIEDADIYKNFKSFLVDLDYIIEVINQRVHETPLSNFDNDLANAARATVDLRKYLNSTIKTLEIKDAEEDQKPDEIHKNVRQKFRRIPHFTKFMNEHEKELFALARKNPKYNTEGKDTTSMEDDMHECGLNAAFETFMKIRKDPALADNADADILNSPINTIQQLKDQSVKMKEDTEKKAKDYMVDEEPIGHIQSLVNKVFENFMAEGLPKQKDDPTKLIMKKREELVEKMKTAMEPSFICISFQTPSGIESVPISRPANLDDFYAKLKYVCELRGFEEYEIAYIFKDILKDHSGYSRSASRYIDEMIMRKAMSRFMFI